MSNELPLYQEAPREKRDGFGAAGGPPVRPAPSVYETPNYRVVVGALSTGPDDQPPELRVRYVVVSKRHRVIAGHSGIEGEAIVMAVRAEAMLREGMDTAEAAAAQGYAAQAAPGQPPESPPNLAWPEGR